MQMIGRKRPPEAGEKLSQSYGPRMGRSPLLGRSIK
jgi:hypothetical protein